MIDYGLTESTIKPEYFSQDDFFIYIASDIKEVIKKNFERKEEKNIESKEQIIYQYNLKRYDKSEYFIEENKKRMQDLTDLEILIYEKVGV